ncbi:adenylate/guanylate cyclase domain-containing protein [Deltaproteobacteria bacterium TL4]
MFNKPSSLTLWHVFRIFFYALLVHGIGTLAIFIFNIVMVNAAGRWPEYPLFMFKSVLLLFLIVPIPVLLYFRPILLDVLKQNDHQHHWVFRLLSDSKPVVGETLRRRVINFPAVMSLVGFAGWLCPAILNPLYALYFVHELTPSVVINLCINPTLSGLIVILVAYFLLERVQRKYFIPYYFPNGQLFKTKKALTSSIHLRFMIFFVATAFVPMVIMLSTTLSHVYPYLFSGESSSLMFVFKIQFGIFMIVMLVGMLLTKLLAYSYSEPLREMEQAMTSIRHGKLDFQVNVVSNDETGRLGDGINEMILSLREKEFIKLTFGRTVDPKVRDHLLKNNLALNGEYRNATLLFCDMRRFTALSEKYDPKTLVAFLNNYFKLLIQSLDKYNGKVDKFIGDEVMATFGVPLPDKFHANNAVKAAIDIHKSLELFNAKRSESGLEPLTVGTCLHTGEVLAGNIGSDQRMEYTVVGETVNLASRLEGLTKHYGVRIVITSDTYRLLEDDKFHCRELNFVRIRGKDKPVSIFEVYDSDPEPILAKKEMLAQPYYEGLMHFHMRNWDQALRLFEKCLKIYPEDTVSALHLARCQQYMLNPPSFEWDGSISIHEK